VAATWQLKILVLGQLVNGLSGSVGLLLVIAGHQNKSVKVFGCSALINVVGNAIAIPILGSVKAAMTTSFTIMVWNIWLYVLVVKNIGVQPSIFSSFKSLV